MRKGKLSESEVRRLYEEHGRSLLAYACSLLGERSSAEDVVHQVFERLLARNIEITGPPVRYLYRAIRNSCLNCLRSRVREVELNMHWLEGPAGTDETAIMIEAVLQQIPEEQREVIVLHLWGQMSFDEVALALGISPNTAASRYRYGLAKLKEQFQIAPKG